MKWFEDAALRSTLPCSFRIYAVYCRCFAYFRKQIAPGAVFLFRCLTAFRRGLKIPCDQIVSINGSQVAVDLSDIRISLVYKEVTGQTDIGRVLPKLLQPGDTFLDVGANHGSYSFLARRLIGPLGRVIAFEPQTALASLILQSFAANGYSNCQVFNCACLDRIGNADLYIPYKHSGISGLYQSYSGGGAHKVQNIPMMPIDHLVESLNLPGHIVVKLDVEGSELYALRGAKRLLKQRRPTILIEINPLSARAGNYSVRDILALLESYGYQFCELDHYPQSLAVAQVNLDAERNIVAAPS